VGTNPLKVGLLLVSDSNGERVPHKTFRENVSVHKALLYLFPNQKKRMRILSLLRRMLPPCRCLRLSQSVPVNGSRLLSILPAPMSTLRPSQCTVVTSSSLAIRESSPLLTSELLPSSEMRPLCVPFSGTNIIHIVNDISFIAR
jgi:hypothetical protein